MIAHRLTILLALLLLTTPTLALEYWPDDPDDALFIYQEPNSSLQEYQFFPIDSGIQRAERDFWDGCFGVDRFQVTATTVSLIDWGATCPGETDPNMQIFEPPLPLVTATLDDLTGWQHEGTITGHPFTAIATVTSETITVPLGTFDVIHVHYAIQTGWTARFLDVWLDRELGPVRVDEWELVSTDIPVGIKATTWSSIKRCFQR